MKIKIMFFMMLLFFTLKAEDEICQYFDNIRYDKGELYKDNKNISNDRSIPISDGKYQCKIRDADQYLTIKNRKLTYIREEAYGDINIEGNYINNKREGLWTFSSGNPFWGPMDDTNGVHDVELQNGKPKGKFIRYYDKKTNKIYMEAKVDGFSWDRMYKIEGDYTIYDINGKEVYKGNMTNGTGELREYDRDGVLKYLARYENGKIREDEEFKNGRLIRTTYKQNGKISVTRGYFEDNKTVNYELYYDEGGNFGSNADYFYYDREGNITNFQKDGYHEEYDENGNLVFESNKDKNSIITYKYYDEDGELIKSFSKEEKVKKKFMEKNIYYIRDEAYFDEVAKNLGYPNKNIEESLNHTNGFYCNIDGTECIMTYLSTVKSRITNYNKENVLFKKFKLKTFRGIGRYADTEEYINNKGDLIDIFKKNK